MDSTKEINPEEIFEFQACQEDEGDEDLELKMDQLVLDVPLLEGEEGNRILRLAEEKMTPLPGVTGIFKRVCHGGEGPTPSVDSIATIHYNAYVEDEISNQIKPFDSTVLRDRPMTFV